VVLRGVFKGVNVEDDQCLISRLQYAGDIVISGSAELGNVLVVKRIMQMFQLCSDQQLIIIKAQ